jgi:thimet oligopeptidase
MAGLSARPMAPDRSDVVMSLKFCTSHASAWLALTLGLSLMGHGPASAAGSDPKKTVTPSHAVPSTLPGPAFPSFDTAAQVNDACGAGLQRAKARAGELEKRKADLAWIAAFDDLNSLTEDAFHPISFLGHVHPDKAVRDAAQACELRWQDFSSTLGQNEAIYGRLKTLPTKDPIDTQFRRLSMENFEDSGVSLPKAKRERAKVIADRMAALSIDFDKNIREANTKVAYREEELKGVPEDVIARAKRDDAGLLLLGLDYPSYVPVMEYAEDGMARERMWRAKQGEGGEANLKLLSELVKLRKEYAQLFGFDNYADFVLRRRMAQDARRAYRFLDELRSVVEDAERREISQLRESKAQHQGQANAKLERWDVSFYSERIKRERYSVDQNFFRSYFPPQESLRFVMGIAERMFGVRYTRVEGRYWHSEVQAYAVTDAATGKPLAGLMVDLYPREGKFNHAAVWGLRGSATRGQGRLPQAALVVNFDRKGLSLDELETLLHEFGHALHNNLSATRYSSLAGTSTPRDFVEAPSQMLEDWVYDPKVLATFAAVCAACKPVPTELIEAAVKARDYGKAVRYSRQHLYASYDLALHGPTAPDPMNTWAGMEGATPLGHVLGTRFPASFGHIAGGYASGYYGYLWSEVVARDMRTAFAADRLSRVTGGRYRSAVLAQGGQQQPADMVKRFLSRESNAEAFYQYLKKP